VAELVRSDELAVWSEVALTRGFPSSGLSGRGAECRVDGADRQSLIRGHEPPASLSKRHGVRAVMPVFASAAACACPGR
jgi:hypothetical protein